MVADLPLMASTAVISPAILRHGKGLCRSIKDMHILLPGHANKKLLLKSNIPPFDKLDFGLPCKSLSLLPELKQPGRQVLTNKEPVLIHVQDAHKDFMLSSFERTEQFFGWKRTLQYLMRGLNVLKMEGLNLSLLSDLLELHTVDMDGRSQQCVYMTNEFSLYEFGTSRSCDDFSERQLYFPPRPDLDILRDLSWDAMATTGANGHLSFTGSGDGMNSSGLSAVSEFCLQKVPRNATKKAMVVPYFMRFKRRAEVSLSNTQTRACASPSCPQDIMMKPQPKKQNRNVKRERYLNRKSYSLAMETLISFISYRKGGKSEVLSMKKLRREISEILTHLSAGIAGIGLAMLFSFMYKMASGRVLLCSATLWNTGFGCLLLWIAGAVNVLRETVIYINKKSNKLKEEEEVLQVQQSVNQMLFRGAILFAAVLLRFV